MPAPCRVLVLPLIGGSYEALRAPAAEFFRRLSQRAPELGLQAPQRRADRRPRRAFVVAALPAALAAYWLADLLAQPLSRRPHRAGLGPPRPRLAGPAGARPIPPGFTLLLALALAATFRAGHARRRRHQLHRRAALCAPDRRARAHALHRPPLGAVAARGSSTPASLLLGPYTALALTVGRPAGPAPQAQAALRPHAPDIRATSCKQRSNSMQVILLERIGRLGQMGDVVNVKDGYARNFLLPQKKALRATTENLERFETDRAQLEARDLELKKEAEAVAAKLEGKIFLAIRQAGDTGQLYGSVTPRDIAEFVTAGGFTVDRRQVVLDQPIKTLGLQPIRVALHPEVIVQVTLNVARSEDEAERQARGEDVTVVKEEGAPARNLQPGRDLRGGGAGAQQGEEGARRRGGRQGVGPAPARAESGVGRRQPRQKRLRVAPEELERCRWHWHCSCV